MEVLTHTWIGMILALGEYMSSILPTATTDGIAESRPETARPNMMAET
jgi:hypothetical protein